MAQVSDAFRIARTLLGDDMGLNWGDPVLMPKMTLAYTEMVNKLVLNGLPVVREVTSRITITAGSLDMGVNQPSDLLQPIKMMELQVGDDIENAVGMTKVDFLPTLDPADTLRFWAYNEQLITFLGSTQNRDVLLYYKRGLIAPTKVTDTIAIKQAENFLGPRITALCVMTTNKVLYDMANQIALDNLSSIVRIAVKGEQSLPVRRKPLSFALRTRRRTLF